MRPKTVFPPLQAPPRVARKHDQSYKLLFSQDLAVKELLTGHCTRWVEIGCLDLRASEKLGTELISPALKRRVPDLIWKIPYQKSNRDMILLIEFQSSIDPGMAARVQEYTALARHELLRQDPGRTPLFLVLVIYNGATPWPPVDPPDPVLLPTLDPKLEAAQGRQQHYYVLDMQRLGAQDLPEPNVMSSVAWLEANPSREALLRVMREAGDRFGGPGQDETNIREAFLGFVEEAARAWEIILPREKTMRAMVAAIQAEKRQITQKALERGRQEGRQEGLVQGLERGRNENLESRREMMVQLAAQKFGEAAGHRLAALLADSTDSDSGRMDRIARAILDCETGDELFARVLA